MSEQQKWRGISLRRLNVVTAAGILVISVLLLLATYHTSADYDRMRLSTERLVAERLHAHELEEASDYLTEQARYYAVSGLRKYLDNYFEEVNVTRRRDRAMDALTGTMAEEHLRRALDDSRGLMEREYYSMRLVVESLGDDPADYPQEVRDVTLSDADRRLDGEAKRELALSILMDTQYRVVKEEIKEETRLSLGALMEENERSHAESADRLRNQLRWQETLIVVIIALILCTLATTTALVIRPLVHAVSYIQEEKPVPEQGANEFRFMAHTYNQVFEAHQELENRLSYDASHDALTGLYNRRGYEALFRTVDMTRAALLLVDVDLFKQVNDTYGHEIGDAVLQRVAAELKGHFRQTDHICRLGGDEFAVIVEAVDRRGKDALARSVGAVNALLGQARNGLPPASLSVGIAYGADGAGEDTLFLHADRALYTVKNGGRRGCAFYPDCEQTR